MINTWRCWQLARGTWITITAPALWRCGDVATMQMILGQQCLDHSKPYLTVDPETVRRAFELAL
ncbi:hypothetical protein [Azotobacter beijerinckii]|uniref:hypothetical protein n=1 Tax=Azotobacter beijerinckii TaxID=170623 RepID=UPI001FCD7143|nr:hypothetical protein [Azotobacter beijerinckii]